MTWEVFVLHLGTAAVAFTAGIVVMGVLADQKAEAAAQAGYDRGRADQHAHDDEQLRQARETWRLRYDRLYRLSEIRIGELQKTNVELCRYVVALAAAARQSVAGGTPLLAAPAPGPNGTHQVDPVV